LIFLDNSGATRLGLIRIPTEFAQGAPLPQQVPALIELDAYGTEFLDVLLRGLALPVELLFLGNEITDPVQDRSVTGLVHMDLSGIQPVTPAI
jgi:hypothetical protein